MKSIASHNGLPAAERAYQLMAADRGVLHAVVEGVTLVEDDPSDHTVGYGGLPNEAGIVELDAAVMDGASHRVGSIVGLRNVRHAARLALCVLEQTKRVMIAGEGALTFARQQGFPEENLLTDQARRMWMYWKRTQAAGDNWAPPADEEAEFDSRRWYAEHFYRGRGGGTVHLAGLDTRGDLACVTSTSGHAFKLPGRVGDSPIPGAGLYVDNEVGSCGSIGHGEATMQNCSSFLAVELMRQGLSPREAGLAALQRVVDKTPTHERDADGRPRFDVQLYLLSRDGTHAGVAIWNQRQIAVTDSAGTRHEDCASLFQR